MEMEDEVVRLQKAEEFKEKGNALFKSKVNWHQLTSFLRQLRCTPKLPNSGLLVNNRQCISRTLRLQTINLKITGWRCWMQLKRSKLTRIMRNRTTDEEVHTLHYHILTRRLRISRRLWRCVPPIRTLRQNLIWPSSKNIQSCLQSVLRKMMRKLSWTQTRFLTLVATRDQNLFILTKSILIGAWRRWNGWKIKSY